MPNRRAKAPRGVPAMSPMERKPSRTRLAMVAGSIRKAATGNPESAARTCPAGTIRGRVASRGCSAGAGPPRSQLRRLTALDRVARASWSIASPERATSAGLSAKRAIAQAAPAVSAMPMLWVKPRRAQSPAITPASAASPPNRWAQPDISRINDSAPSCVTQGLNLPAHRRRLIRNAASRNTSAGRVSRSGHKARASVKAMPRRNPARSANSDRLASDCALAWVWAMANGSAISAGSKRSTRSAARRGNHSDRRRRSGMTFVPVTFSF